MNSNRKFPISALAGVAQLVGASSCGPKACGFDAQSWHMPRLKVEYQVGACTRKQPIDVSFSHLRFCLSSVSLSLSVSTSLPLSLKVMGTKMFLDDKETLSS